MNNLNDKIKEAVSEIKINPGKIFGVTYILIFVIGIALGVYYVKNLNEIGLQKVPVAVPDTTGQKQLRIITAKTIPPVDVKEISNPTDELITKGEELYAQICASCHGENGEGNGPAATGLNPQPRSFVNPEGWKNSPKISGIYKTLEEGIEGSGMISYDYLTPEERFALAHYIRTTFMSNPLQDTEDELVTLDQTYALSLGKQVPAQIPVDAAAKFVLDENKEKINELVSLLKQISKDSTEAGAKVFDMIANNKVQALASLKASTEWKQSREKFTDVIYSGSASFLYNKKVRFLTDEEWSALYNYMSKYF